jgi:hypothetical protein
VEPARLALALGPRLAEPGRHGDDHAALAAMGDLELVALADGDLVNVAGEDQVGARADEGAEHVIPSRDRLLA